MSSPRDIRDDLEPGAGEDLVRLAERLRDERPIPSPVFRGELGRRLARQRQSRLSTRVARRLIAAYATAGTALMAIAALGASGHGL